MLEIEYETLGLQRSSRAIVEETPIVIFMINLQKKSVVDDMCCGTTASIQNLDNRHAPLEFFG